MIYYIFNPERLAPGQNPYRYSDTDTPSIWINVALRHADRVFNNRHDQIYIVKDRYEGVPEKVLSDTDVAWIILRATALDDLQLCQPL